MSKVIILEHLLRHNFEATCKQHLSKKFVSTVDSEEEEYKRRWRISRKKEEEELKEGRILQVEDGSEGFLLKKEDKEEEVLGRCLLQE